MVKNTVTFDDVLKNDELFSIFVRLMQKLTQNQIKFLLLLVNNVKKDEIIARLGISLHICELYKQIILERFSELIIEDIVKSFL